MSRKVSLVPEFKVVLIGECGVGKSSLFMRVGRFVVYRVFFREMHGLGVCDLALSQGCEQRVPCQRKLLKVLLNDLITR